MSRCTSASYQQHALPRTRGAFLRPGFATLFHSPRIEGWAERRETFGCSAEHPLGLHITRQARRLRGALRPMTQQDTSRNNLKISTFGYFSVPIVSQTEIDPMKTALSVMLRRHDDGPQPSRRPYRKPPGRAAHARTAISHRARSACRRRALRTPSPTRATAPARGDGFRAGATACETGDAINPNSLDGPAQCLSRDLVTHRFK